MNYDDLFSTPNSIVAGEELIIIERLKKEIKDLNRRRNDLIDEYFLLQKENKKLSCNNRAKCERCRAETMRQLRNQS